MVRGLELESRAEMREAGAAGMRTLGAMFLLVACATLLGAPRAALADGKRDLSDGIAFYENLDTERAVERLKAASQSAELSATERGSALLYLGMIQFEGGDEKPAAETWRSGFDLDLKLAVPSGTSPKTAKAIEAARALATRSPRKPPAPVAAPEAARPAAGKPEAAKPPPGALADPAPPGPAVAGAAPPAVDQKDEGVPGWIIWGGIGAAVIGAGVVALVVATGSSSDCEGAGGCAFVQFH